MKNRTESDELKEILIETFKNSTLDNWDTGKYVEFVYNKKNIQMDLYSRHLTCKINDNNNNKLFECSFSSGWKDKLGIRKKYNDKKNHEEIKKQQEALQLVGIKKIRRNKIEKLNEQ